jgi:glycosyltransferase involved in cell wall biosynthesis
MAEVSVEEQIKSLRIALMLPCLNEELTLAKVIRDFKREIPSLEVYVFDNQSTDRSREIAIAEGAKVVRVCQTGKGYVVRKMFEVVDADLYVMVDSDDTYDASGLKAMLKPLLEEEADMVVGSRLSDHSAKAFRKFHRFGNALILNLINFIFRSRFTDICSGYRAMTRHFVKNIPFMRNGFEVETELTVYSMIYGFSVKEVSLPYRHRPPNSHSKLRTFSDGYKVLLTIVWLARDLRPLLFFAGISITLFSFGVVPLLCWYPGSLYLHLSLTFLSLSLLMTGLILNTMNVKFQEMQVLNRRNFGFKQESKSIYERPIVTVRRPRSLLLRPKEKESVN